MANYLLGVIQPTGGTISPEDLEKVMARVAEVDQAMHDAGAWVFAGGLTPVQQATTVDNTGDAPIVSDGPYAESKEYLGGFWVIQAADLDEALAWATRATRACRGPVEVRPFQDNPA